MKIDDPKTLEAGLEIGHATKIAREYGCKIGAIIISDDRKQIKIQLIHFTKQ